MCVLTSNSSFYELKIRLKVLILYLDCGQEDTSQKKEFDIIDLALLIGPLVAVAAEIVFSSDLMWAFIFLMIGFLGKYFPQASRRLRRSTSEEPMARMKAVDTPSRKNPLTLDLKYRQ